MTIFRTMTKSIARPFFRALPISLQDNLRRTLRPEAPEPRSKAFSDAGIDVAQKNFNHLLHHLRGQELGRLPQRVPCFISVGCAGTWYFEWVQEKCAPLKHIGIEYYSPKPTDLPENVEWIANTAGDMSSIATGVGDVLFSGQNIEHLWPHDIGAFLLESHRVLKPGGILVIDSPNRLITSVQNWSHPEHILEFTPAEATELIAAAGFKVEQVRGMWLCADPRQGTRLPFDQLSPDKPWPMARRIRDAITAPDDSFSWWIVARKTEETPDSLRMTALVEKVFRAAWPDRVGRMQTNVGLPVTVDGTRWLRSKGESGALMFGPYMPLPKGSYSVGFDLRAPDKAGGESTPLVAIDVMDGREAILASRTLCAHELSYEISRVELDFELGDTTFGLQYRVIGLSDAQLECRRGVSLRSRSDDTFSAG
ncbi:class I SAM-dependent methyltransferase [Variovorax sp. YR216]|uniref:class I SAM-dependent methyltransferase n=1 Tax=Variovorax sp. YR216 TaxID=1882828 RepID=UPI00089CCE97|nr:class I SAM-dependent methyltransferase [Variovorax sp. YR216]SEA73617.1 Methyltransferase domain-containing protein [Variovorax sp. YR216]